MITPSRAAELGGIISSDAPGTIPASAHSYTHLALEGRTVVRLTPDALGEVEDITLTSLGFTPGQHTGIGRMRQRAIGFPAWPIIHDPKNARHALNLVGDLQRAAKAAKSKPGNAKLLLDELAKMLGDSAPHFLPTFLEEAARIFLRLDNRVYAAQYFSKAREAERVHSLKVDEDRNSKAFLEFALAGAITAKELTNESKTLCERYEPERALDIFLTLNIDRVKGGMPPYGGLAADLKRLAKAAHADPVEVHTRFLRAVLSSPSLSKAPAAFWRGFKKAIPVLVAQEPTTTKALLALTPSPVPSDEWIDILDSVGLSEDLAVGRVDAREWVERYTRMLQSQWNAGYPRKLSLLIRRMKSLKGQSITLSKRVFGLQPELLDALLSTGAKVEFDAPPGTYSYYNRLSLSDWAETQDRPGLDALAESEHAHLVLGTIGRTASDHLDVILSHSGARAMLGRWAESTLGEHPTSQEVLSEIRRLSPLFTPAGLDAYPRQISALVERLNAGEILADVFRDGFLTEYTWPELEAASAELGKNTTFHESFPSIGIAADGHIIWVDGDKRIAEASFAPTATDKAEYWHYLLAGEATACAYRKNWEYFLTWSTDPGTSTQIRYYGGSDVPLTLPFNDGRLVGKRLVHGGDGGDPFADRALVLREGEHYWRLDDTFREIDPATGQRGRESLPAPLAELIEPYLRDGWELEKHTIIWCPVFPTTADSSVSTAHGRHAWLRMSRDEESLYLDANGHKVHPKDRWDRFKGRMARPGGGHWLLKGEELVREDDFAPMFAAADARGGTHLLHRVPQVGWNQFRVRDEAASDKLRHATPSQLEELLKVVPTADSTEDAEAVDPGRILTDEARAAAASFLGSDCHALVDSVVWATARVKRIVEDGLERTTQEAQPTRSFPEWEASCDALSWANIEWSLTTERDVLHNMARRLGGAELAVTGVGSAFTHLTTRPIALLFSVTRPLASKEFVGQAAAAFGDLVDEGLYSPSCCVFEVAGIEEKPSSTEPARLLTTPSGPAILIGTGRPFWAHNSNDKTRFFSPSGGVPKSVDGAPISLVTRGCGIEAETIIEAFRVLLDEGAPQWDPAKAERLAEGTGWTRAAASLFLAGLPNIRSAEANFLDKDLRTLLGLKVAEAREGREFLSGLGAEELLRLIEAGASDPLRLAHEGIDVEAVIAAWSDNEQVFHLPGALLAAADSAFPWGGARRLRELSQDPNSVDPDVWLWAAAQAEAGSRFALWLAQVYERMKSACRSVKVEWQDYGSGLRTVLGLPAVDENAPSDQVDSVGPWSMTNAPYSTVFYDPNTSKDFTEDRRLLDAIDEGEYSLQRIRKRLDVVIGVYDEIADALVDATPGCASDPLVSAPEVVSAAAKSLGVPEDSARYWLQILALTFPSDKNVESWNSWSKKLRLAAAAPLLEAGLLVEAKRARAGRSLFLPGGWQEASTPHKPMEVWKAPFYDLTDAPKVTPRHDAVVPLVPLGRLFEDAWQRYVDGDVPGYTELRTTRYRRR